MSDAATMARKETDTQLPLIDRVRSILPEIAARVGEAEAQRFTPAGNVEALRRIGFLRALVPSRYGGEEVDLLDFLQAQRLLASVCVSTGWFAGVIATHAHGMSYYSKQMQDEIWADGPDTVICSSFGAVAAGEAVEGGYRLSGTWDFSSGSDHASWVQLGFRIERPGEEPTSYLGLLPRSDFEIVDNWDTVGLRGTGSKRIEVKDVFIPDYRCWGPGLFAAPLAPDLHDHWLYNIPFILTATNFVAVILGAADGAVASYKDGVKKRIRSHTGQPRIDNPMAFVRLAESVMDLRAATAVAERRWEALVTEAKTGVAPSLDEAFESRGDEAYAVRLAMQAVDRLMGAAGGNATRIERPLQRFWRDIHAAGGHAWFDMENKLIVVGRHSLGLPADPYIF